MRKYIIVAALTLSLHSVANTAELNHAIETNHIGEVKLNSDGLHMHGDKTWKPAMALAGSGVLWDGKIASAPPVVDGSAKDIGPPTQHILKLLTVL